jgi:hypothetical protein
VGILRHQPEFASDCPFGSERGLVYICDTIKVLESTEISDSGRQKMNYRNAKSFFSLTPR